MPHVLVGDSRTVLPTLAEKSVRCCVTSPPYWGLRQYLFDKALVIRYDLTYEQREKITEELKRRGVIPRQADGKILEGAALETVRHIQGEAIP